MSDETYNTMFTPSNSLRSLSDQFDLFLELLQGIYLEKDAGRYMATDIFLLKKSGLKFELMSYAFVGQHTTY